MKGFKLYGATSHCEKRNQSLAPFTHTDFTGKLLLRDHVWTEPFEKYWYICSSNLPI